MLRAVAFVAVSCAACASAPEPRVIAPGTPVTAFRSVTVITEYGGPRLDGHTVAVRDDRIIAVTPDAGVVLPEDARVIEGGGRWLAPGIADMHVHYAQPDAGPLLLANSITTVRNPSGGDEVLALMADVAAGGTPGPFMYASGQLMDGPGSSWGPEVAIQTVDGVRARVGADAAAGYIAVKLYNLLRPEQFTAAVEEACTHQLQVYVHVPYAMTLAQVMALRVDAIEHLDGFDRALGGAGYSAAQRWASAPADRYVSLAAAVQASGVWNAPTLIVSLAPARAGVDLTTADAAPEMRYAGADLLDFWHGYARVLPPGVDAAMRYTTVQQGHANRVAMLSALREAGAPVLIGTDAPNPYVMYGFAIHEEFGFFREAGYSNTDVLRIATRDAARFLGRTREFGVVGEGARADLLLLADDPETDLAVLRAPAGVMAAGRWYDAETLRGLLDGVAARAAISRSADLP